MKTKKEGKGEKENFMGRVKYAVGSGFDIECLFKDNNDDNNINRYNSNDKNNVDNSNNIYNSNNIKHTNINHSDG